MIQYLLRDTVHPGGWIYDSEGPLLLNKAKEICRHKGSPLRDVDDKGNILTIGGSCGLLHLPMIEMSEWDAHLLAGRLFSHIAKRAPIVKLNHLDKHFSTFDVEWAAIVRHEGNLLALPHPENLGRYVRWEKHANMFVNDKCVVKVK